MADPWQWLILIGTLLFTVSLVPQLARTLKRRRADDLSALFIVTVLIASVCNMIYFGHIGEAIAASGFVANIVVWGVVLRYRLWPTG